MRAIVTRPRAQAASLARALEERGFEVVLCPLIEVEPIEDGPIDVGGYDWVVVTSPNGAEELARRRTGEPVRMAAIGPGTRDALAEHGLEAVLVPEVSTQEGLVAAFPRPPGRVLFVGAEGARRVVADELGADFRSAYRTVELRPEPPPRGELVLLASASAARAWGKLRLAVPAISIGPQTTEAARAAGVRVDAEAETHDIGGLVDSAAAWRASSRS